MEKIQMPAGRYYVGDLCYLLGDEWDVVCDLVIQDQRCLEGKFTLPDGRDFVMFGTMYGDGSYDDNEARVYLVDSGSIGCMLVPEDAPEIRGGNCITFQHPFEAYAKDGALVFGSVRIETGDQDWNDRDEDEDEEEYA
jgi:hypothetical protein